MSNRTSSSAHQQEKVRRRNWRKSQSGHSSSTLLPNGLLKASKHLPNGWVNQNKEFRTAQNLSQISLLTTSSTVDTINRKKKHCMGNLLNSPTFSKSTHAGRSVRLFHENPYLSNDEDILDDKIVSPAIAQPRKTSDMIIVQPKKLNGMNSSKALSRCSNGRFQSAQVRTTPLKTRRDMSEEIMDNGDVETLMPVKHEDDKQIDCWIRRKFYIVENGGRPAEVYCTDFVHKAKHGDSKFRSADETRLMKIVDRWREEWNHGVQMPLCAQDTRETYTFEKVCLFPNLEKREDFFELPRKYIALNEKRYVNLSPTNFEVRDHQQLYLYELDREDEKWINKQNALLKSGHNTQIKEKVFLDVINALELDCYTEIHLALMEPLNAPVKNTQSTDEDAECDICRMPEWEPGDEIVFCDGCNICVHQSCYGLDSLPTEEWLCTTCSLNEDTVSPPCIFCPIRGGAMKYTKTFETWSHVLCALWLPEVRFGDVERREPITCVSEVPAERWQSKCSVCDTREGACISCTVPGCNTPFHVSCAQRGGLVLRIEHSAEKNSGVAMISLCRKHSATNPHCEQHGGSRKRSSSSSPQKNHKDLEEMLHNFSNYVDCQKISENLDIPLSIVTLVFKWWQIKRKENKCQPLINEPLDASIRLFPPQPSIAVTTQGKQSGPHLTKVPSKKVLREYDYIRTLRQNLERARNLSYMISKREKMKKALVETFEETSLSIGFVLLNGTVPISQRRTDKLLELWDVATRGGALTEDEASQEEELGSRESSTSVMCNRLARVAYLPSSVSRRKNSATGASDVFEFRGSNSPAREEDTISNSGISTLTEYSLAISNSDSSTLCEFDFENVASIEEAPKNKKNKKVLLHNSCCKSVGKVVMTPVNYYKDVKKQRISLPQLNESEGCDFSDAHQRFFRAEAATASHEDKKNYVEFVKVIAPWDLEHFYEPYLLIANGALEIAKCTERDRAITQLINLVFCFSVLKSWCIMAVAISPILNLNSSVYNNCITKGLKGHLNYKLAKTRQPKASTVNQPLH